MEIKRIGELFTHEFSYTFEDVKKFAELSGDMNPIHLDPEYASKTFFKKTIIHGYLSTSVFSKVFGTIFPGEGTIYIEQMLSFLAPMYPNQKYFAFFEVEDIFPKNKAKIKTYIKDEDEKLCVNGYALISNKSNIVSI